MEIDALGLPDRTMTSAPLPTEPTPIAPRDRPHWLDSRRLWHCLALAFLALGTLQRLVQYVSNRSLWGDEASLALNIRDRAWGELLWQALDANQAAPSGFLAIEKGAIVLLGDSEYSLRLWPLLAGLLALAATYWLAKQTNRAIAVPLTVAFVACLRYTSYYATEVKQYSSDMAIALGFYLLLTAQRSETLSGRSALRLALLGGVAVWFSHPVVFIMAGVELCHWLRSGLSATAIWRWIRSRWLVYGMWLASFAAMYGLTIRKTLENEALTASWGSRYPDGWTDIPWLLDAIGRFFYRPLDFLGWTDGVAIAAFVIGVVLLAQHDRGRLDLLLAPAGITLVTSYLHVYPFRERLVLFLAPFVLTIVAEGIAAVVETAVCKGAPWRRGLCALLSALFLTLLVGKPLVATIAAIAEPRQIEEIRPVIEQIRQRSPATARLYVYAPGRNQFLYYAPHFDYQPADYRVGEVNLAPHGDDDIDPATLCPFTAELSEFAREATASGTADDPIWLLFSRTSKREQELVLALLAGGRPLAAIAEEDAFAYLYDLRDWQPTCDAALLGVSELLN